jgi:hypothetical protein
VVAKTVHASSTAWARKVVIEDWHADSTFKIRSEEHWFHFPVVVDGRGDEPHTRPREAGQCEVAQKGTVICLDRF